MTGALRRVRRTRSHHQEVQDPFCPSVSFVVSIFGKEGTLLTLYMFIFLHGSCLAINILIIIILGYTSSIIRSLVCTHAERVTWKCVGWGGPLPDDTSDGLTFCILQCRKFITEVVEFFSGILPLVCFYRLAKLHVTHLCLQTSNCYPKDLLSG